MCPVRSVTYVSGRSGDQEAGDPASFLFIASHKTTAAQLQRVCARRVASLAQFATARCRKPADTKAEQREGSRFDEGRPQIEPSVLGRARLPVNAFERDRLSALGSKAAPEKRHFPTEFPHRPILIAACGADLQL